MEAITPNDGTPWDCIGDTIILDSCRVINFSSLTFNAQVYGLIRGNIFQQGGNCNFWNDGWIIEGNRFVGIGGVSFFGGNQTITANSFSGSYLGFDGWGRNSGYSTTISLNNISDGGGIGCLTYGVFLSISSNNISGGGNILVNGNGQIINNTVENAEGSGITACGIWTIYGNAITTSKQSGIFLTGAAGINVVSHNTVTGNGFGTLPTAPPYVNAGIACMDSLFTIDSNIVTGNSNGVICPSGSIVINNDIHDNTNYDFMVAIYGITDVNAYNNWWGTTDTVQIHAKIYDYIGYQNSSRALIDPVAPAEIPGAGVR
jgi:parallel beta-helix repeat protein